MVPCKCAVDSRHTSMPFVHCACICGVFIDKSFAALLYEWRAGYNFMQVSNNDVERQKQHKDANMGKPDTNSKRPTTLVQKQVVHTKKPPC